MYKPDIERLSRIKSLRQRGLTIDQIAAATGYPRSSVGYYVRKYCGGRAKAVGNANVKLPAQPEAVRLVLEGASQPKEDKVNEYLRSIEEKERLSVSDILSRKRKTSDHDMEVLISDLLEKDPNGLYTKLKALAELIRFASFLRIDLDKMRETLVTCLKSPEPGSR